MKKIVKYSTIVIICLYAVYLAYYEFGLFSRYNYFTAKEDLKKGDLRIIQFGLTIPSEGRYIIQNKYNVNIDYKGCVVNDITNGLYYYNEVKRDYYREKYGLDFWERYYKEIDEYDDSIVKLKKEKY